MPDIHSTDTAYELESLFADGNCCAQMMVKLFLEEKGTEDSLLTDACFAFCNGLHEGRICGALIGGALMLSIADKRLSRMTIPELCRWFEEEYGGTDCRDIAGEHGELKSSFCMDCIEETYEKAKDILEEYGI